MAVDLIKILRKSTDFILKCHRNCYTENPLVWKCVAEMLGTLIFILFGCGAMAQSVLSRNMEGNSLMVGIGFSTGLAVAGYVAGGISGGHVNPAVSLALVCVGKLKWQSFLYYVIAQFIGAFLGAAVVYGVYYDAIMDFTSGDLSMTRIHKSGHIFASYPAGHLSILGGLFDQVVGTALLVLGILAVTDQRNIGVPRGVEPIAIGLVLLGISVSMGLNCGYPLNPARDLAPRLFTAMAGWGMVVFTAGNHWWWIPVVGPMIGGPIGALLYNLVIRLHPPRVEGEMLARAEEDDEGWGVLTLELAFPDLWFTAHLVGDALMFYLFSVLFLSTNPNQSKQMAATFEPGSAGDFFLLKGSCFSPL